MSSSLTLYCAITAENGNRVPITVSSASITPTQLRLQASEATKIPLAQLRLIFRGRMIKDDTSLDAVTEYKLEDECVLHCMGKPNKDGSPASSDPQPAAAAASAPTISAAAPPTGSTTSAVAPPNDPLQEALEQLRTNARSPDVYTTAISVSHSHSVRLYHVPQTLHHVWLTFYMYLLYTRIHTYIQLLIHIDVGQDIRQHY
jgi:hypothetical protein